MANTAGKNKETHTSSNFDPEKYDMKNNRRGQALIFNQVHFKQKQLDVREGSDVDCSALVERLRHLGFEVQAFKDQTKKEVEDIISKAARADHSDADCFLLVFMSHGEDDHVHTYDREISIKDITDEFKGINCESLVGKPKIFIWEACRGNEYDSIVKNDAGNEAVVQTLPTEADVIMCYSVAKGYYSIRNTKDGSWFIQNLCQVLQMRGDSLEFTELLTVVNKKVSMRSITEIKEMTDTEKNGENEGKKEKQMIVIEKKQVPCFASMLTKKLYFLPKH